MIEPDNFPRNISSTSISNQLWVELSCRYPWNSMKSSFLFRRFRKSLKFFGFSPPFQLVPTGARHIRPTRVARWNSGRQAPWARRARRAQGWEEHRVERMVTWRSHGKTTRKAMNSVLVSSGGKSNMAGWKIPGVSMEVLIARKITDRWSIFQHGMFDYQRVAGDVSWHEHLELPGQSAKQIQAMLDSQQSFAGNTQTWSWLTCFTLALYIYTYIYIYTHI